MMPFLVCFGAFVIIFLAAQAGMRSGAFLALSGMLTTVMALLITLRVWFLASLWLSQRQDKPVPILAIITFWAIFIVTIFILKKVRQNATDAFESVETSLVDRVLGAAFGLVGGLAIMGAAMMTLTIASAEYWPAYKAADLPLPLDRWPLQTYRLIETQIAGIGPKQPGHTPLPSLKATEKPAEFWQ